MNVFVLMKQTLDTEEKISMENGTVSEEDVKFVINPYDEYAVEEAIQVRDEHDGRVTVVSVGPERTAEALRTALAMGADEAVLIEEDSEWDEYVRARLLADYVTQHDADLILGGHFSVDNGAGQTAIRVAHLLQRPHVGAVTKLQIRDRTAQVERDAEGDVEKLSTPLPAVFTAQQGLNEPRYPSLPGIMKAKKKPLHRGRPEEFGLNTAVPKTIRNDLSLPPRREAGIILEGERTEQVRTLVERLQKTKKVLP